MELKSDLMDAPEYKELFKNAKLAYPNEYDYILHLSCIRYFMDNQNIKSDINIDSNTTDEI
jgi:hypothetical protein